MLKVMPVHLKDMIEKINQSNDGDQISCVIASIAVGWALEVAEKMGIKRAAVWPGGLGDLAIVLRIPKLIQDGMIDTKGTPIKDNLIWLSKEIPARSSTELPWSFSGDSKKQNFTFEYYTLRANHYVTMQLASLQLIP
ncbi:hypothetical protein SO802_020892 [Lithocarpus litseifolius]|uniref:Uncharacterized protein n=1 Tax=Lithocarpus litseifolius TaxID=425828 RepID=A0AAW2CEI4_9ROSI